ncbi:MAG: hypothetical protein U9N49_03820 [Campylobacterota bacterium]|nr:hypothetical protein [Campylobacterota bacterium]
MPCYQLSTGNSMTTDTIATTLLVTLYFTTILSWLHRIYLSFHDGFLSLIIALGIPPWTILKGFVGFF